LEKEVLKREKGIKEKEGDNPLLIVGGTRETGFGWKEKNCWNTPWG